MSVDSVKSSVSSNVKKITGKSGSYDSSTSKGKAANAGEEVGELLKGGNKDINKTSDISYSSKKDGSVDVDAGLAYSSKVVESADDNDDGGITLDKEENAENSEQKKAEEALGIEDISVADENLDGLVDKAEYLALTILQDCTSEGGPDAVASAEEAKRLNEYIKNDISDAKANISAIYDGLIADKLADFEMPLTKAEKALQIAQENDKKIKETQKEVEQTQKDVEKTQKDVEQTKEDMKGLAENQTRMKKFMEVMTLAQQLGIPLEQAAKFLGVDISEFSQFTGGNSPLFGLLGSNLFQGLDWSGLSGFSNINIDPTKDLLNPFTKYAFTF